MPNYQPVSRERHADQRWLRPVGYAHAQQEAVVPLVVAELPKAMMSLPIAFIEQAGAYTPVAVLSLLPGKDLFVAESGSWAGDYIPAAFRSYPFRMAATADGKGVLCIDEDSSLITDDPAGQPFFNPDGTIAQAMLDILNFLNQIEQSRTRTAIACAVLQKHQLICPWLINLKTDTGEQAINGLFQINEAALNQLPVDALLEVRNAGALHIAYCQLLSMQHLVLLGKMIEAHGKAATQAQSALQQLAPNGELDIEFLNKGGTFNFSGIF